jgi:hypothetical protein
MGCYFSPEGSTYLLNSYKKVCDNSSRMAQVTYNGQPSRKTSEELKILKRE